MVQDKKTFWDGVRNYQARNNLTAMTLGDLVLFYHSNVGKEIVGIVRVAGPYAPDPSDATGTFGGVAVEYVKPLTTPVTLDAIKKDPALQDMALLRQSRLSVMPITAAEWRHILKLGQTQC